MQTDKNILLDELFKITENSTLVARKFKELSNVHLNFKKSSSEWSILECIEHLNLYGDYYLPEMEKQILSHKSRTSFTIFKSGVIGNYFSNLMRAKNGKVKRMKSPKDKIPVNSKLTITTIDRFLKQQELLKSLLIQARTADLTKIKTAISLSRFIKLRLGDTFRFFVYHIERHILQAERVLQGQAL